MYCMITYDNLEPISMRRLSTTPHLTGETASSPRNVPRYTAPKPPDPKTWRSKHQPAEPRNQPLKLGM